MPDFDLYNNDVLKSDLVTLNRYGHGRDDAQPKMREGHRIVLNQEGFASLANAIRLSYIYKVVAQRGKNAPPLSLREKRSDYDESSVYTEFIDRHALTDERIDGSFRVSGNYPPESISDLNNKMEALIESEADIANLRLIDLDFNASQISRYKLDANLKKFSSYEKRRPIARQFPNDLTRLLKCIVIDYFEDEDCVKSAISTDAQDTTSVNISALEENALQKNQRASGQIPQGEAKRERVARQMIDDFHDFFEGKRISCKKARAYIVPKFSLTGKGFEERVWNARKIPTGTRSGNIPKVMSLTTEELETFHRTNEAKYVI